MDIQSLKEKAESDLLWKMAMLRFFKRVELRCRFKAIMETSAIEIKRLALVALMREYKSLIEE